MGNTSYRLDPLYRITESVDEFVRIEGKLKPRFDRLKNISNLGVIAEVFETAKYPKYEHTVGLVYQVDELIKVTNSKTLPDKYKKPLRIAPIFLHIGHFPYTLTAERALIIAAKCSEAKGNKAMTFIDKTLRKVFNQANLKEEKDSFFTKMLKLLEPKLFYRIFSAKIMFEHWSIIEKVFNISKAERTKYKEIIIKDMLFKNCEGYKLLELANKVDYVQRDALYFGTVRLDISPRHIYSNLGKNVDGFNINEQRLIDVNQEYLNERFYDDLDVIWFSRLLEKIIAALILSKKFNLDWLLDLDDTEFKRLLCGETNKKVFTRAWTERAKAIFNKKLRFEYLFSIDIYHKYKDIIEAEHYLVGKNRPKRSLLSYPFKQGLLYSIDYYDKNTDSPRNKLLLLLKVFWNEKKCNFSNLLKAIEVIIKNSPPSQLNNIKEGIGKLISWTKQAKISNDKVVNAITKCINELDTDSEKRRKRNFSKDFVMDLFSLKSFKSLLMHNFDSIYLRLYSRLMLMTSGELNSLLDGRDKMELYESLSQVILTLPSSILQMKTISRHITKISEKLESMILEKRFEEIKGDCFEALWLIKRLLVKENGFRILISGMTVVDPDNNQDQNEFDLVELVRRKNGEVEIYIYECSLADNYKAKNKKKIEKIVDHIKICFDPKNVIGYYVIPENKREKKFNPKPIQSGRGYSGNHTLKLS